MKYLVIAQNLDGYEPIAKIIEADSISEVMKTFNQQFEESRPHKDEDLEDYDFYLYQISENDSLIPIRFEYWED